jgi:hypothetical protein
MRVNFAVFFANYQTIDFNMLWQINHPQLFPINYLGVELHFAG